MNLLKRYTIHLIVSAIVMIVVYLLLHPMFQEIKSDTTNCAEFSVRYEKGTVSPTKNFTGQYYKGDIIPVEGVQLKIHYFPQQDVVRVKFMSEAVDDETGEKYQYADWTPGQSRRLRVGKSIIVVTLDRIFQHEKEETQVELPWFNNDPLSP